MKKLLDLFKMSRKAKEIPSLTNFLVNNPFFRRWALAFHKEKTETAREVDDYLEKQFLTPEQYEAEKQRELLEAE